MCGQRPPGPMCQVRNPVTVDEGTMCMSATPPPRPVSSEMCGPRRLTTLTPEINAGPAAKTSSFLKFNAFNTKEQNDFERQVYEGELRWAKTKKTYFPGLSPEELEVVEGKHELRKDAAKACRDLLSRARTDLLKAKEEGKPEALRVTHIGIASAYRDPAHDFAAWQRAFRKHYESTKPIREKKEGGEHGRRAVAYMVEEMIPVKAVAGFSNHTSGIAVDFKTTDGKQELGPDTDQHAAWRDAWFYKWLHAPRNPGPRNGPAEQNAGEFVQLVTEEWHWDYKKGS